MDVGLFKINAPWTQASLKLGVQNRQTTEYKIREHSF